MKMTQQFFSLATCGLFLFAFAGCGGSSSDSTVSSQQTAMGEATDAVDASLVDKTAADTSLNDAKKVLAAAIKQAQEEDKRVFVHLGAPW